MVKLGGYCSGSLQSYKVHLAIPQKHKYPIATRYVTATFNTKEAPLARWSEDEKRLRIWSSYEQWGRWRKSFEFLVPELREYFVGELVPYVLARCLARHRELQSRHKKSAGPAPQSENAGHQALG